MRSAVGRLALIVSLLVPVYFMAAALGVKFGLWPWQFGLGVLVVKAGLPVLIVSIILALVALVLALVRAPRRGWPAALIALLIPALAVGYLASVRAKSADIPPIHDVATDTVDPPQFSPAVIAARQAVDANPVASMSAPLSSQAAYQGPRFSKLAGRSLGEVGRRGYPGVRPLQLAVPPAAAYAAALAEAKASGWELVSQNPDGGTIEATAETFWFGFKDDVVVRIRPGAAGSTVDVRSTSRVGLSDLGANAARIEAYLAGLDKRAPKASAS